jgi:hypothetical protein
MWGLVTKRSSFEKRDRSYLLNVVNGPGRSFFPATSLLITNNTYGFALGTAEATKCLASVPHRTDFLDGVSEGLLK